MKLKIFKIFWFIFIFLKEIKAKDSFCFNTELEQIGCSCNEPVLKNENCFNGIVSLSCLFHENSTKNYIENALISLNKMDNYCWTQFYFENVLQLNSYSFTKLVFSSKDNKIVLKFKNIQIIKEHSFKSKYPIQSKLTIEVDSPFVLIEKLSFSSINAKLIVLKNIRNLSLYTSIFQGSYIDTIQVEFSNFSSFISDSKFETIKNFNIVDSLIDNNITYEKTSGFKRLENIHIKNSGLKSINTNIFSEDCCFNLKQLQLTNNLIKSITKNAFKSLTNLKYLNLDNNPIESIEEVSFQSFSSSLKKLSLKSIQLDSIDSLFKNMSTLNELSLSDTLFLKISDLKTILTDLKHIEYLDISNSNMISNDMNEFLDETNFFLNSSNHSLFYLDARKNNANFNNIIFKDKYADIGNCLWSNLGSTFIRINSDQECSCALFYLYKNLTRFKFPVRNGEFYNYINLQNDQLYNMTVWQNYILPILPKCYRNIWLQTFSLDKILEHEEECKFEKKLSPDCNNITHHTTIITSTSTITKLKPKFIESNYTIPVIASICSLVIFTIIILILKAKYDYKNRFLKLFEKNFDNFSQDTKELSNLQVASNYTFNIQSFDPRDILQQ